MGPFCFAFHKPSGGAETNGKGTWERNTGAAATRASSPLPSATLRRDQAPVGCISIRQGTSPSLQLCQQLHKSFTLGLSNNTDSLHMQSIKRYEQKIVEIQKRRGLCPAFRLRAGSPSPASPSEMVGWWLEGWSLPQCSSLTDYGPLANCSPAHHLLMLWSRREIQRFLVSDGWDLWAGREAARTGSRGEGTHTFTTAGETATTWASLGQHECHLSLCIEYLM